MSDSEVFFRNSESRSGVADAGNECPVRLSSRKRGTPRASHNAQGTGPAQFGASDRRTNDATQRPPTVVPLGVIWPSDTHSFVWGKRGWK